VQVVSVLTLPLLHPCRVIEGAMRPLPSVASINMEQRCGPRSQVRFLTAA
jgi:hypothetical protein